MHSVPIPQNLVALMNFVPLHSSANLNKRKRWQIGVRSKKFIKFKVCKVKVMNI